MLEPPSPASMVTLEFDRVPGRLEGSLDIDRDRGSGGIGLRGRPEQELRSPRDGRDGGPVGPLIEGEPPVDLEARSGIPPPASFTAIVRSAPNSPVRNRNGTPRVVPSALQGPDEPPPSTVTPSA